MPADWGKRSGHVATRVVSGWIASGLAAVSLAVFLPAARSAEPVIFRSGDEVIIRLQLPADLAADEKFASGDTPLTATVRIDGDQRVSEQQFPLDPSPGHFPTALVVDVTGCGSCRSVSCEVRSVAGRVVQSVRASPVPSLTLADAPLPTSDQPAAIEAGTQGRSPWPVIRLPDAARLRPVVLGPARREVRTSQITYPVFADVDLPALSSFNAVLVSRQTAAPDDPQRCSLYFSYRKALFDPMALRLTGYRKLLIEVPLQRSWLTGTSDEVIDLPLDQLALHTTDELERMGERWNAPQGYNMLGESMTGLYQGGQTADLDDQGRIYISNVPDGAGLVRFNPHTARFEQPPVNLQAEFRRWLPSDGDWRRSWDADLPQIVCTRGRAFLVFDRNYRAVTPNGRFETCSGVVSVPWDHWDDAEAFRRELRLHAASWPSAQHPLYSSDVEVGAPRRAGAPVATEHGIAFGSWRLDVDDRGQTERLVKMARITDAVTADGAPVPPTRVLTHQGLGRQREINVGAAGRALLRYGYGEVTMSRAALSLILPGAAPDQLVDGAGKPRSTYPGAPPGQLTVRFDPAGKILSDPARYGSLAKALTGVAQGPNYGLLAIPGEADQAVGVCEYSYYFSRLDFSRRHRERRVYRSYLPAAGSTVGRRPIDIQLGPYNLSWVVHDRALWLYSTGYTGLGRLKFRADGQSLDGYTQNLFHAQLASQPLDGRRRDAVKDYLHLVPALDGRWIAIGRGRPGRGGGAYSAALEIFDPRTLGASHSLAVMNRCYGLYTPVSRVVLSASGAPPRQEIYVASGEIRPEYVADIADPAERPRNQEPKIFVYDCTSQGALADRYGFSLPVLPGGSAASHLAFSRCRQFLVVLQEGGAVHSYSVAQRRFVDSRLLRSTSGTAPKLLVFSRPSTALLSSPEGRIFCAAALDGEAAPSVTFVEIDVTPQGVLEVTSHLTLTGDRGEKARDLDGVVKCLLPDLTRRDGSADLVLGDSLDGGGPPTVRVIDDFIAPR
ncbi:MAG: hypothetical protein U0935_05035 [Pirellulales bacterium]